MPELRWILIGCGCVLLIGIYLWGRRGSRQEAGAELGGRGRPEPQFAAQEPLAERFEIDDDAASLDDEPELPSATRPEDFSITAIRATPHDGAAADAAYSEERFAADAEPYRPPNRPLSRDLRRGRIEPTLDHHERDVQDSHDGHGHEEHAHEVTAELPTDDEPHAAADAPTLGMSNTPQPKRIERRKIVALRLAGGAQRFAGGQLRQLLEAETLDYGKYDVFHRLHADGGIVFSVASMVEPGTFDLDKMVAMTYPGVTLFAQLPGPVPGIEAMNELVACGKRLQERLGGTLQDERGVPLTVHRIERLRQEVRDFESGPGRESAQRAAAALAAPPP